MLKRLGWWRTDDGRWFRHCNEDGSKRGFIQSVEWAFKSGEFGPHLGFYYDGCDYGEDKKLYIGFIFGRVWIGFGESHKGARYGFEIGRKAFYFWWNVKDADTNAEGGKHVVFFWRRIADWVFGKAECFTDEQEWARKKVVVPMPEGDYPAIVKFESRVWVRRRSPFHRVRRSTSIDIPMGIPFSGKGENAWDLGEDGLYGCGCEGHDAELVIEVARTSALEYRAKRGDPETWPMRPEDRAKAVEGNLQGVLIDH